MSAERDGDRKRLRDEHNDHNGAEKRIKMSDASDAQPTAYRAKKRRWDDTADVQPPAASAPPSLSVKPEASAAVFAGLEQAKAALLLQRQIADKLAALNIPAAVKAEAEQLHERRQWTPLRLDELGRQVDASGSVVSLRRAAELKINQQQQPDSRKDRKERKRGKQVSLAAVKDEWIDDDSSRPYFDPSLPSQQRTRGARALQFVPAGTYERKAAMMRMRQFDMDMAAEATDKDDRAQHDDSEMRMEQERESGFLIPARYKHVPNEEWWDQALLKPSVALPSQPSSSSSSSSSSRAGAVLGSVTSYVYHPVAVLSLTPSLLPPPKPIVLTARERKKLKRRARLEQQKENQEKVRLGLLPPPPPKLRLSNLQNALVNESVAEPSEMERRVREEMRGRREEHDKSNRERALDKEQRKEKARRKLRDKLNDGAVHVAVFAVRSGLGGRRLRFLLDRNAGQWNLTGLAVMIRQSGDEDDEEHNGPGVVVVEGGRKGLRRFQRLMLVRIDWKKEIERDRRATADDAADEDTMSDDDDVSGDERGDDEKQRRSSRWCELVWCGEVAKAAFPIQFGLEMCRSEIAARALFAKAGVEHYFDLARAASFSTGDERDI